MDSIPTSIPHVSTPKRKDIFVIRLLICCGLISMCIFCIWFLQPRHIGNPILFWLLTFALSFKFFKMLQEWYHYWSPSVPQKPEWKTQWKVDVLTTACPGEPRDMIIRTLEAMQAITYPHTSYLCDEGDDPILKEVCRKLGVVHVTRIEKKDAKAGNINNALRQATGDICVVLDPDHVPVPEFLDRVLPYFEDPQVGYVQCVQGYSNQRESLIARGAAEQSYHFYGPMMMTMNTYGTVQAIGANCTFRRKALDSIGGHAAGLAEDMHTAMQLQAKGWKPLYIPEMLSRGLVPATLSAYYKQQLKWSRGCFELLFRTYPTLFTKFTWRQKINHFTMPIYFLFGLVNLIDILVPLLALGLAEVPWEVDVDDFVIRFSFLYALAMLIRTYAQRWLLEKSEYGFHLTGGLLRMATWWVFLIGFIYSILNIKVPYIPTPKEDEHQNYFRLSLPNILTAMICGVLVWYGLKLDWTPYSIAMGVFALVNAGILVFIALMSQQKFLSEVKKRIRKFSPVNWLTEKINEFASGFQHAVYGILGVVPIVLLIGVTLVFLSSKDLDNDLESFSHRAILETGGFYLGINYAPGSDSLHKQSAENKLNRPFDIISFKTPFGKPFPKEIMRKINQYGSVALINWEFVSNGKRYMPVPAESYLKQCAEFFRECKGPVFIHLFPGFKRKELDRSNAEEFVTTWQYIHSYFSRQGVSNITWVWSPQLFPSALHYYPGDFFVDWININYPGKENRSLAEICQSFKTDTFRKPVMVSGFRNDLWAEQTLHDIKAGHKEIRSVIFTEANLTAGILELLQEQPFSEKPFMENSHKFLTACNRNYKSPFVKGSPGKFQFVLNGEPYYIKGVAYNTGHDWRDGNIPLTRKQLEKDFTSLKEMGANTIRRYGRTFYDKNILTMAEEKDLKVIYGFYFDPKVDYYRDTMRVLHYIKDVERTVLRYKNYTSILGWSLGNEVWGLLKKKYARPYLTQVRAYYIKMIEHLAQRIHELDPAHPVFSCMEDGGIQLAGELTAFHNEGPSIDILGINSYYQENISRLASITSKFDSMRPYLVSEFGPYGYWDTYYNKLPNEVLIEQKETEKAEWYKTQWCNYVEANKGKNIGGFAYCWKDRMEATNTWFGLTDYKGRFKPSYYALKEAWKKIPPAGSLPNFTIELSHQNRPGDKQSFTALSPANSNEQLEYEWMLFKNDYLEKINSVNYSSSRNSVQIEIPDVHEKYRLYLYVNDKDGNVTTASLPIIFK